ncbi:hypothetical protein APSETT444_004768 [Aspergillus pseudonomiae]
MAGGTESPGSGNLPSRAQKAPKNPAIVAYLWDSGTEGQQQTEDDDKGDASTHTFLSRVYSHLKSVGQSLPRNLSRPAEEVLNEYPLSASLIPLDRRLAEEYIDCFHGHSCATYRYIPRSQSKEFLHKLYSEDESFLQDDASMAVILLILAVGSRLYEAAQSRLETATSVFPPSILVMQAHCLKCQFLLAVNIFNGAWLAVGTAVRLGQIVGFHKAKATASTSLDEFTRRGVFWSLYIMDRLARITTQVLRKLYGSKKHDKVARNESVSQIEAQLSQWLDETPGFFNPQEQFGQKESEVFYDIPWIFKRTTIVPSDANASVTGEQQNLPSGSVYPRLEPREEWEDTQGAVNNIEGPVSDVFELADIVNGDDLDFIMDIGFDASPFNHIDPLQYFVADRLSRPGPQT